MFSSILSYIFKFILHTSKYSSLWRKKKVKLPNHHAITIIHKFAKVFEIYIHSIIYRHVLSAFSEHQHGFINGRCSVTNFLCTTQYFSHSVDVRVRLMRYSLILYEGFLFGLIMKCFWRNMIILIYQKHFYTHYFVSEKTEIICSM